jgi:hypothetical protein
MPKTRLQLDRAKTQTCVNGLSAVLQKKVGKRLSDDAIFSALVKESNKTQRFIDLVDGLSRGVRAPVRQRLFELSWGLLIDSCRAHYQEPTVLNLLGHSQELPALIDSSFPGYVEGGMFPLVLTSLGA